MREVNLIKCFESSKGLVPEMEGDIWYTMSEKLKLDSSEDN